MGKLIRSRLPAFSLPETIVALVIILSVFAMATMILVGTGKTHLTVQQLRARYLLQLYAGQTRQQKAFYDNSETEDSFLLRREVSPYPDYDSVLRIHYYIYDRNHRLLTDWQLLERSDE